jgi:hypothetical protein
MYRHEQTIFILGLIENLSLKCPLMSSLKCPQCQFFVRSNVHRPKLQVFVRNTSGFYNFRLLTLYFYLSDISGHLSDKFSINPKIYVDNFFLPHNLHIIACKLLEHIFASNMMQHLETNNILYVCIFLSLFCDKSCIKEIICDSHDRFALNPCCNS